MEDNIKIQKNILLKKYSTFGIGARAGLFVLAKKPEDVISAVSWAQKRRIPVRVFAGGSNIFFEKDSFRELLICVRGGKIIRSKNGYIIDSGVPLDLVVKKSLRDGYGGLESLTAIPGTIGGAIFGNAGAYGHSISEVVKRVLVFDGKKTFWINRDTCKFGYRDSIFKKKNTIILRAEIFLKKGKKNIVCGVSKNIRLIRSKKYPPTLKCPGSFFKNVLLKNISKNAIKKIDRSKIIEGKIPAGYLLESVGARGMCVGGIKIAEHHGNLFINIGSATTKDVNMTTTFLKRRVKKKFGIDLEEEIVRF